MRPWPLFAALILPLVVVAANRPGIGEPRMATRLRVIGTADFHGAIDARPDAAGVPRGGAAALAGMIAAARAECVAPDCESIVLDGGDMFQGTAASNTAFGRPVVEIFDAIGYTAAALGNHEFDWGQDTLRALMHSARYAILGANVRYADGRDVEWIRNDTLVRIGTVTVGVIGISTRQTPTTTRLANVTGLRFDDPAPIVDSIAAALRRRGAQAVVVVAHAGGTCSAAGECQGEALDMAARLTQRVDAIVAGHSHTLVNTVVNGVAIVEARSSGRAIGVIDIPIGGAQGEPVRREVREIAASTAPPSAQVKAIADRAIASVAPLVGRPVATIAQPISGSQGALGNLIADAMRVVGRGDLGVMNTGGVRAPIAAGTATYGQLFETQPFSNILYRVRVRGSDLRAYFQRALSRGSPNFVIGGARLVYHSRPSVGIDSLVIGGRPIDDRTVYTVVINDFMLSGGDNLGFGPTAVSEENSNIVDLDALIAYLRNLPQPVVPNAEPRVINSTR